MNDAPTLYQKLEIFLFCQPNALKRLARIRICLTAVILVWVLFGPFDGNFYQTFYPIFSKPSDPLSSLMPGNFTLVKMITLFSGIALLLGFKTRISNVVFAASFLFLNYYVSSFYTNGFGPVIWNYNTHLNIFAIALCFTEGYSHPPAMLSAGKSHSLLYEGKLRYNSFILSFMQVYVAVLYFQSGLSKLIHSGVTWFSSGDTLYVTTLLIGTPVGLYITQYPFLFKVMAIMTGIFETGFLFTFLINKKSHKILAATAIIFHLCIYAVIGISFWHLWILFPALFLIGNNTRARKKYVDVKTPRDAANAVNLQANMYG